MRVEHLQALCQQKKCVNLCGHYLRVKFIGKKTNISSIFYVITHVKTYYQLAKLLS